MRMIMDVRMPLEPFNTYAREGVAGHKIGAILEDLHPEAVYFTEMDGERGAILVVDLADPSEIPKYAEPFFLTFDATVRLHPAMSPKELGAAGLDELGRKWTRGS